MNWRSPLLIIAPVSVRLGHWSGGHVGEVFAGILSHPGREKIPFGCSKISQSLKLQRRKTSCERREEEVKTKHWRIQSSDLIFSSSCCWKWRIPTVESTKTLEAWSLHCGVGVGGVCWGLKFMNTRKIWLITSKFEKYWLGQSDLQSCLAMWRIEHHCSKMFFLVKRSGG